MDWAYVNPITGYFYFSNLKIYEPQSDSIFFSADGLGMSMSIVKMFSKVYEISEITFTHPRGIIIQNKDDLNFDDLIKRFSSKKDTLKPQTPSHFNILNVKVKDGMFAYRDVVIPVNFSIKNVNFECTGKRWDTDTTGIKFSFLSGIGSGDVKGDMTINFATWDYHFATVIKKFDLQIIEQYLKDLTNYGRFTANLDADVRVKGSFNDKENITAIGLLAINDFHFGKSIHEDYASFTRLSLKAIELGPKTHKYLFDSVSLIHPGLKYERYDDFDNVEAIFGNKGSGASPVKYDAGRYNLIIAIGRYVKALAQNFSKSNYKINRLAIEGGDFKFNDFSAGEQFSVSLNPMGIAADSVDKDRKRATVYFKSGIKPYGNGTIELSINPRDSGDFDMKYRFQKIPVSIFNPYTIAYSSFPVDRGTLSFDGSWTVRNNIIKSKNHLVILDPRVTKQVRNKDASWIPVPLILFFIRERGNVIDYEIPITGNLKNPKFNLHDVLVDALRNIFVKPPTTPYRIKVKSIEIEIEKSLALRWEMRHSAVISNQVKFIEKMADFLVKNPEATIAVYPQQYALKEKEYIVFFEAKKKYYLVCHSMKPSDFSEEDKEKVEKMSVKDPAFVRYLNKHVRGSEIFSIQDKCAGIIASSLVRERFRQLNKARTEAFVSYFKKRGVEKQLKLHAGKNVIPYNGFSFYKIVYKDGFPEPLMKAYRKMNELNAEEPRSKFKKERKNNKDAL